jgi:hypothetical protein
MSSTEKKLKECVSKVGHQFKNDKSVKQFVQISKEFNELVLKGLAQERGNNLLSLSDQKAVSKIHFNTRG